MTFSFPSRRSEALFWYILLPLLLIALVFPFRIDGGLNPQDDGIWLSGIQSLISGKMLYRDIWLPFNPLIPCLSALAAKIHPTLGVIRGTFWVLNLVGLLCASYAAILLIENTAVRLIVLLWLWLVPSAAPFAGIPMSARYGAGFLPILAWPVFRSGSWRGGKHLPALAGFLSGLAFWVSQEAGTAAIAAGGVVFLSKEGPRASLRYAAAVGAVLALGGLIIACTCGLPAYIHSAIVRPAQITLVEKLPFPSLAFIHSPEHWPQWLLSRYKWQRLSDALTFYLPALLYPAGLVWAAWGPQRFKGAKAVAAGLAIFGILTASSAWGRSDRWHMHFSVSPALLLGAFLADRVLSRDPRRGRAGLVAFVILGGLITLPHFYDKQIMNPRYAAVSRPSTLPRAGSVRLPPWQANAYEALVSWIQTNTPPGESVLYYPFNGAIYFLADRTNPVRIPLLIDAINPEMQQDVVRDIERTRPLWIIWDTQMNGFGGQPMEQFLNVIDRYIHQTYAPHGRIGPFLLLERKRPALLHR